MSLFDRNKKQISRYDTFSITQSGRDKLQMYTGDTRSQLLVALETEGSSNIDDLAKASGISRGQLEHIIPQLLRGRLIQTSSACEGID